MCIPPNTMSNQYFGKDECGKYCSLRLDEALCGGRITRDEVNSFFFALHKDVGVGCLLECKVVGGFLCSLLTIMILGAILPSSMTWIAVFLAMFALCGCVYGIIRTK